MFVWLARCRDGNPRSSVVSFGPCLVTFFAIPSLGTAVKISVESLGLRVVVECSRCSAASACFTGPGNFCHQ